MPLGSVIAIQPKRQPGTIHRFDNVPRVTTGAMCPKTPMGINGLSPNT